MGSWQARRDILNALFNPVHQDLANLEDAVADLQAPAGSTAASPRSHPGTSDRGDNSSVAPAARSQSSWDVFISYATEDKQTVAEPLASALQELGVNVWYDDFELQVGDSLRQSIDTSISRSRFGLIILSKPFFDRNWTTYELNGLVAQANSTDKRLLPIWHKISQEEVTDRSAPLADIVALRTSDLGIDEIANQIANQVTSRASAPPAQEDTKPPSTQPVQTRLPGQNTVILTAGPHRHSFSGVTVSPHKDRNYVFLDVRKDPVSSDDYASLCEDLATTDRWQARLDIAGAVFDFANCTVTPNQTSRKSYYVDVRAHTDTSVYQRVVEALAAAARHRS